MGQILSLVRLDESHAMARFPRGQEFVSSGRLVQWAKDSAGKRLGPSGHTIGNGHLKWACSEAAVLCLRHNPAGQKYVARVEPNHGQGNAVTILAHKRARAVYALLKRQTAFDRDQCLQGSGSRAGAPDASRATPGLSLAPACSRSCGPASWNATVRIGLFSQRPRR
jgi:Transposase IS116/IS110/IS902 family